MENYHCPFLSFARMSWFYKYALPLPITEEVLHDPIISPMHSKNFKGLPPTLIYPADIDALRDEGLQYAKKLQEEGDGWVECVLGKDVPHPFVHQV
ncbi:MAG TPA: alpha/beta hydrolase fold domain-containing protein [Chlamydiales bacterium]|nr:alpha/beta hydrolase fold domain-containing protein [Chlamydiales bacterium]